MSAEVATASVLWKPLAWIFGGLLAIIKLFIGYIWVRHQKDVDALKSEIVSQKSEMSEMRLDMTKNYYDKEEIGKHIVDPLREDMRETNTTLKLLSGHYGEMQQDLAILKHTLLSEELRKQREQSDKR